MSLTKATAARVQREGAFADLAGSCRYVGETALARSMGSRLSYRGVGRLIAFFFALAALFATIPSSQAAEETGTVFGRVVNEGTGGAVSSARVTIEGTSFMAVSDVDGRYRIRNVPAGDQVLVVEYGSSAARKVSIDVVGGQAIAQNLQLRLRGSELSEATDDGVFELEPFEVQMEGEFNAHHLAINEERYSNQMKDVVAADQFGENTDGNVGEFVKFLPGLHVNYGGGYSDGSDATSIGIRGFGADQTKIMVDGMEITGSDPFTMSRAVNLDMISINNASRIEVTKIPTADMPDGAVGGAVNLVSRTAFEYPSARFSWRTYLDMNSENLSLSNLWSKTPGPANKETYKMVPGVDFSYVLPVNEKFGVSFNFQRSQKFNENHTAQTEWKSDRRYTNADGHYDDATNPFLRKFQVIDRPSISTRSTYNAKVDWRPLEGHSLSFNASYSAFDGTDAQRRIELGADRYPLDWGTNEDGTGFQTVQEGRGQLAMNTDFLDRVGNTKNYYLKYDLDRGPWTVNAAISTSRSKTSVVSAKNGHFSVIEIRPDGIENMSFDRITDGVPLELTLLDEDGNPFDIYDINNYEVSGLDESDDGGTSLTVNSGQVDATEIKSTYKVDVRRDLDFISTDSFRIAAKAGFHRQSEEIEKSGLGINYKYRYIGPVDAFDPSVYEDTSYVQQDPGFGFEPFVWIDPYKVFQFYQDNPDWFTDTEDVKYDGDTVAANNWIQSVQTNKNVKETTDSYYLQLESAALNNKLTFVTGMRWSETNIEGFGPFQDKDSRFLRNSDGSIFYREDGGTIDLWKDWSTYSEEIRQELVDNGFLTSIDDTPEPIVSGTLQQKKMEYVGSYPIDETRKGDPLFSFQTAYEITSKLKARVGYAKVHGNPELETGILNGKVEFDYPNNNTSYGKIKIGNPNLEPYNSEKLDYSLSYYTDMGGKIKVGYFTNDTTNYVLTDSVVADSIETLSYYGLPESDEYINWTIESYRNGTGVSHQKGYELDFNQNLGFLGEMGKAFNIWGSFSTRNTEYPEDEETNLDQSAPKDTVSYGFSFRAGKLSGRVSALDESDRIRRLYTWKIFSDPTDRDSESTDVDIYQRYQEDTKIDVSLNYQMTDKYGVFFSARNILNSRLETALFTEEEGVLPEHIDNKPYSISEYGFNMQLGLRGTF